MNTTATTGWTRTEVDIHTETFKALDSVVRLARLDRFNATVTTIATGGGCDHPGIYWTTADGRHRELLVSYDAGERIDPGEYFNRDEVAREVNSDDNVATFAETLYVGFYDEGDPVGEVSVDLDVWADPSPTGLAARSQFPVTIADVLTDLF